MEKVSEKVCKCEKVRVCVREREREREKKKSVCSFAMWRKKEKRQLTRGINLAMKQDIKKPFNETNIPFQVTVVALRHSA